MRTRFRAAFVILALMLAAYLANFAFRLMNQSSDLSYLAGVLILVALIILGPYVLTTILRKTAPRPKACGVPEEGTVNAQQTPSNRADSTSAGS